MKKLLVRSKSETDWFKDKENLDIINNNLRKFKNIKILKEENQNTEKETQAAKIEKPKNLKQKAKISLLDITKEEMQNSNKLGNFQHKNSTKDFKSKHNYIENSFKDYLKMILRFKLEFDRKYFEKEIEKNKSYVDIKLETILIILKKFKDFQIENIDNNLSSLCEDSDDSSMDSAENNDRSIKEMVQNENFKDNLEKFQRLVEILIKTSPDDLFKEVKSMILNEYESTISEIKTYLEINQSESSKKFLLSISSNILFIISQITYKLDYYTITINCLVEKLNKFFINFVESTSNCNEFTKSLDLVQRFVKIKKTFMKEFIDNKQQIPEEENNKLNINTENSEKEDLDEDENFYNNYNEKIFYNFAFNKFYSFGRYFFNNMLLMLDMNIYIEPDYSNKNSVFNKDFSKGVYNIYKYKFKRGLNQTHFIWKNKKQTLAERNRIIPDKYFKLFFNSKLASWKYALIQPGIKKIEICRICETTFEINEFVLHLYICKEQRMNLQSLLEIKHEMKKSIEQLKEYRESLLKDKTNLKDIFFSPKSEYNQIYRIHLLDRTPKLLSKRFEKNQNNFFLFNRQQEIGGNLNTNKPISSLSSEVEFLDKIIQTFSRERDLSKEYYEKFPYKLSQLMSIVHFTIYIFFQNKNSPKYSEELNNIFSKLFIITMKKMNLIENLLSLKDSQESARSKIKNSISQLNKSKSKLEKSINAEEAAGSSKNSKLNPVSQNNDKKANELLSKYTTKIKNTKSNNLDDIKLDEESSNILNKAHQNVLKRASIGPSFRIRHVKSTQNFNNAKGKENELETKLNPYNKIIPGLNFQNLNIMDTPSSKNYAQFTNPKTSRIIKKDSLKDFCDILDLTKSKLTTRRVLNKIESNSSASKIYLQTFSSKLGQNTKIIQNQEKPSISSFRKDIVKMVSSELKSLTKISKPEEQSEKAFVNVPFSSFKNQNTEADNKNDNLAENQEQILIGKKSSNVLETFIKRGGELNKNINQNKNAILNRTLRNLENDALLKSNKNKKASNNNLNDNIPSPSVDEENQQTIIMDENGCRTKNDLGHLKSSLEEHDNSKCNINSIQTNTLNSTSTTNMMLSSTGNSNINLNTNYILTPNNNTKNNSLKKSLFEKVSSPNFEVSLDFNKHKKDSETLILDEDSNKNFILNNHSSIENHENKLNDKNDEYFDTDKKMSNNEITELETLNFHKFDSKQLENFDMKTEICFNKIIDNRLERRESERVNSEEYYTGSIKLMYEQKPSQKSLISELNAQIRNIDQLNQEIKLSDFEKTKKSDNSKNMIETKNSLTSQMSNDSLIDSEVDFHNEENRDYKEESLVNEVLDEVDSQFDEMIELMDDIQLSDPYREVENDCSPRSVHNIKISDFKIISEISSGGYGRVDLYKKISTGDIYAIKTVDINKMISKNISGLLKNEALIMNEVYSEYIVKCYYIFSDDKNYYYVMEYMSGGDLHHFLNEYSLGYETIQLIIAEVILALEYLHSKNIIHRDIKPENIVISQNGHFKLTDFGISEIGLLHNKYAITNKNNSENNEKDKWVDTGKILGTQNYMAPEVIKCEKITYSTDYWSVGVILYELFTNKTPFYYGNLEEVFDNILNLRINWEAFEAEVEDLKQREIAKDLIKKFLISDPLLRWGDRNIEQVKSHKFFENFDWKNVKSMKNLLVLKHVSEKMKQLRQAKPAPLKVSKDSKEENFEDEKNKKLNKIPNREKLSGEKQNTKEGEVSKETKVRDKFNLFYSERIDNLNEKNEAVLKNNLKTKKIEMDADDVNFTNLMHDLD